MYIVHGNYFSHKISSRMLHILIAEKRSWEEMLPAVKTLLIWLPHILEQRSQKVITNQCWQGWLINSDKGDNKGHNNKGCKKLSLINVDKGHRKLWSVLTKIIRDYQRSSLASQTTFKTASITVDMPVWQHGNMLCES